MRHLSEGVDHEIPDLKAEYERLLATPSDMQEHLPTLYDYAQYCQTVIECGMRTCVSSMALLMGLAQNGMPKKLYIGCDTEVLPEIEALPDVAKPYGVTVEFKHGNDLELEFPPADLVLIDTWHCYGQLKRELATFAPLTPRIILHDTTVDALLSESVRMQDDLQAKVDETGWDIGEIVLGLWPAVTEFLAFHPEWKLEHRYENCFGLAVLSKGL